MRIPERLGMLVVPFFALWAGSRQVPTPSLPSVPDIIARNTVAMGGEKTLASIGNLSFAVGSAHYTADRDGRLRVRHVRVEPAVYEVLLVDGPTVRRNRLGVSGDLSSPERDRWIGLARFFGGGFSLLPFARELALEGRRSYGAETYFVLSSRVGGLIMFFFFDPGDDKVKRLVFEGTDEKGTVWEQVYEFGPYQDSQGVKLPSALYFSQVGEGGSYAPGARPLVPEGLNAELSPHFFRVAEVRSGTTSVGPGWMEGVVLAAYFQESTALILTNWTEDGIKAAGLANGDVLILGSGGAEFETKLYVRESQVDDPGVYDPGRSLFTSAPAAFPGFYVQFNQLTPPERFEELKSKIKILAPIRARKKD